MVMILMEVMIFVLVMTVTLVMVIVIESVVISEASYLRPRFARSSDLKNRIENWKGYKGSNEDRKIKRNARMNFGKIWKQVGGKEGRQRWKEGTMEEKNRTN